MWCWESKQPLGSVAGYSTRGVPQVVARLLYDGVQSFGHIVVFRHMLGVSHSFVMLGGLV